MTSIHALSIRTSKNNDSCPEIGQRILYNKDGLAFPLSISNEVLVRNCREEFCKHNCYVHITRQFVYSGAGECM